MSIRIIQNQLDQYNTQNPLEEENALKEITQEVVLSGLARADFFKHAAFQGGTCLRIVHGLNRFSEDLDFALNEPDPGFRWDPYLKSVQRELKTYDFEFTIQDRSKVGSAVKTGFLKENSVGKILAFRHRSDGPRAMIRIELEIDTNPPAGATIEQRFIHFPVQIPIVTHDISSLFAGKSHAILSRRWDKGRDWYDFIWYVAKKTPINFKLLSHALKQSEGFEGTLTKNEYLERLRERVRTRDWEKQKNDISRFLKSRDQDLIESWGEDFFLKRIDELEEHL